MFLSSLLIFSKCELNFPVSKKTYRKSSYEGPTAGVYKFFVIFSLLDRSGVFITKCSESEKQILSYAFKLLNYLNHTLGLKNTKKKLRFLRNLNLPIKGHGCSKRRDSTQTLLEH